MSASVPTYRHRSKPYAHEATFALEGDGLVVTQGHQAAVLPLRDIVRVRLTYRPRNSTHEGYEARFDIRDRKKVALTNLSWKSLVEVERLDAPYSTFVRELIARSAAANPAIMLEAGMPLWVLLLTGAAGSAAILALLLAMSQAVSNGAWPVIVLTGALALYFIWWTARYIRRNRPRSFAADSVPSDVMPPAE